MKIDSATAFACALIAMWIAILVTGVGTPGGWITDSRGVPIQGDFTGLYTAGQLAWSDGAGAAYDWDRHKAAQQALVQDPKSNFFPWPYPPSFLFAAAALALLPYYLSMLTWTLATFAAFAAAVAKISKSRRDMLLMLAAPAAWLNMYVGQNGALTAALVGLGLLLLPARPVLAGLVLGLLSYKPHLGLLLPIALAAGGYWIAFAASAASVAAIAVLTTGVFGIQAWLAMPAQLERVVAVLKTTTSTGKIQSFYGIGRALGAAPEVAMGLQTAAVAALVVGVAWVWRQRRVDYDLKAALLATAMTLASPYQFVYDLVILTIAQAFLLRHIASRNIAFVEIAGLKIANLLVFMFAATPVPLGVVASMLVLTLVVRRIRLDESAVLDRPMAATPLPAAA